MTEDNKRLTIDRSKRYVSPLFRQVPRTKIKFTDPEWDNSKCWHCQELPRIIGKPDVIIWCMRCYKLQFKMGNGTYRKQSTIPIGKDLLDIQEGKVKIIPEVITEKPVIQE